MRTISNEQYDAVLRLLNGFLNWDNKTDLQQSELRRKTLKTIKYLKRNRL